MDVLSLAKRMQRSGMLLDPAGLLEGSGKYMRHVKVKPGREIDSTALNGLIDAAYLDVKALLKNG